MINKKGKTTKCSGKLFLLLLSYYLCMLQSECSSCMWACWWGPEKGTGTPEAGSPGGLKPPDVSAGTQCRAQKSGEHAWLWHRLSSPFLNICWEKTLMWPRLASNLLLSQLSWPLPPKCWDSWNVHHNWIMVLRITPKTLCILGKNSTNGLSSVFKLYTTITHEECNHKEVLYKIFCKTVKAYVELLILCPIGAFLWHSTDKKNLL